MQQQCAVAAKVKGDGRPTESRGGGGNSGKGRNLFFFSAGGGDPYYSRYDCSGESGWRATTYSTAIVQKGGGADGGASFLFPFAS